MSLIIHRLNRKDEWDGMARVGSTLLLRRIYPPSASLLFMELTSRTSKVTQRSVWGHHVFSPKPSRAPVSSSLVDVCIRGHPCAFPSFHDFTNRDPYNLA